MKEIKKKISIEELRNEIKSKEVLKPKLRSLNSNKIFKELHGYSKRMRRNMSKHNLNPMQYSDALNEYRGIRRKRKKAEKAYQQDKHFKSVVYKRTHKKVKGKQQGKKKKEGE